MKIPDKIIIAGCSIDILFDRKRCNEDSCNGLMLYDSKQIIINPDLNIEQQYVVLIHECIHYLNAIMSLQNRDCDDDHYINPISELFYQIIKQIENK